MNKHDSSIEDHSRVIIHIDFDCFYAQVEMIKNQSLIDKPFGVQQKSIVVTSNYVAREHGIKKCMSVTEALKTCPNLILVRGEDLHDYRKTSYRATNFLQRFSPLVERLGLDENFIDVSNLVNSRLNNQNGIVELQGHIYGDFNEACMCGCLERLKMGSVIAQEIRDGIKVELKLTTCAGIAHNKLLAKLVGCTHKPNQQTTILPHSAYQFILSLRNVSSIPGIGLATSEALKGLNITVIEDLHSCDFEMLKLSLGEEKAKWLVELSYGRDPSSIKPSGKPQSIGLEDSCKPLNAEKEIKEKFQQLLTRLIILVSEDGRIPTTIKVTVRKFDNNNKISHRETRQCNINSSLFNLNRDANAITLTEQTENKLLSIIMNLFKKLVDISQSYHITLLGLSFTKFQEQMNGKNSIASYFVKDVSVQSLTSLENTESKYNKIKPSTSSTNVNSIDSLESEVEPSPKKSRLSVIARRFSDPEYSSPSKLRVADLRLNSKDDHSDLESYNSENSNSSTTTNENIQCPPTANEEVFRELPTDMQLELWKEWKRERNQNCDVKPNKRVKTNTLLNYFVRKVE